MSTPPPTYENYPPAGDAGWRSTDGASPEQPRAPLAAPTPPPTPPGPGRRTVVRLIGGGAAALVAVAIIANNQNRSARPDPTGWATGAPAEAPADEDDEDGEVPDDEIDLGGYTVSRPAGWTVDDSTDVQAVLVKGGATAIFRAYTAGDDVTATEEARRLLDRHTAGLGKRRTGTPGRGSGSPESASIEASGTRGDGVRVDTEVHVAIGSDEDREALAVIALLPSGTSKKTRTEVTRMRREFLDQLV